jgi:hypothetical protein
MILPQKSRDGCQYREKDGEPPCGQEIEGRGAWQYCPAHSAVVGRERAKEDSAKFRKVHPDLAKRNKYLCENQLTENKLEPCLQRGDTLREQYASSNDDFCEAILHELNNTKLMLLNPRVGLFGAFKDVKEQVEKLPKFLRRQRVSSPSLFIDRLIILAEELVRDVPYPLAAGVFAEISGKAKKVQEQWRQLGELHSIVQALFVDVEINRLKFLADPTQTQFLKQAHTRLDSAEYICGLATNRCTGERKRMAAFLQFYVELGKVRLTFDIDNQEQASKRMEVLQPLANEALASYGTGPITETVRFLTAMNQVEYHIKLRNTDLASDYFEDAEKALDKLNKMRMCSIEAELHVAYVKAELALAKGDQNRHKYLEEYITLFRTYPFLTHYKHLQELIRLYPKDIDVSIFKGVQIYMDTLFRHLCLYIPKL